MNWDASEHFCISIAVVGAAIAYIYKAIKFAKRPKDEIDEKLQRDYNRINGHDRDIREIKETLDYIKQSLRLQMENDKVILEHMRTNNSTGKISEREKAIFNFLQEHQQ